VNRSTSARVCIIGAGPSGITTAKNCLQVGLRNIVVYERQAEMGGNWVYSPRLSHSSVYETTHIITSKRLSAYEDFPMPADYPDYPSHRQVLSYFQAYARQFGVLDLIRFNTTVERVEENSDRTWTVTLAGGAREQFDYVMIANGHHWDPRMPTYPGTFTGQLLHSHDYRSAAPFRDQRVLVVGGGNSACDIAVETARVSAFTAISMRRGYYIAPKFTFGQPADVLAEKVRWMPHWLYGRMLQLVLRLNVGDYADYGLQRPQHKVLQQHLTLNSELLYYLRHGRVHARRDIARFDGRIVHFTDGRAEEYDTIIAATGFRITFPFLDPAIMDFAEGQPVPLYLLMMHPDHPSLFVIGLVQPLGCIWPLSDLQAKLAANAIIGRYQPPPDMRQRIARDTAAREAQFIRAQRHNLEVEYFPFRERLLREIPAGSPAWSAPAAAPAAVPG
jgi:cation diffusion facilitator CzcD-associated flavoprotein CzcO